MAKHVLFMTCLKCHQSSSNDIKQPAPHARNKQKQEQRKAESCFEEILINSSSLASAHGRPIKIKLEKVPREEVRLNI